MDKQQLAEKYATKKWRGYHDDTTVVKIRSKEDFIAGYSACESTTTQREVQAKIAALECAVGEFAIYRKTNNMDAFDDCLDFLITELKTQLPNE